MKIDLNPQARSRFWDTCQKKMLSQQQISNFLCSLSVAFAATGRSQCLGGIRSFGSIRTERLKSRKTKLTLIYNPRRRAQEFLGRFQKRPTREGASPSSWSETTNSDYLSRDEIGSVALSFPHLRALRRCS